LRSIRQLPRSTKRSVASESENAHNRRCPCKPHCRTAQHCESLLYVLVIQNVGVPGLIESQERTIERGSYREYLKFETHSCIESTPLQNPLAAIEALLRSNKKSRIRTTTTLDTLGDCNRPPLSPLSIPSGSDDVQMSPDRLVLRHPVLNFLHERDHIYGIKLLKAPFINRGQAIRNLQTGGSHVSRMDESEFFANFHPEIWGFLIREKTLKKTR
jgi:hypothetical protein